MEDGQDNSDDNIGSILDTLAEQWKQQHGDVIPSTSFQDTYAPNSNLVDLSKAFIGSPVLAQVEKVPEDSEGRTSNSTVLPTR